MGIVMFNKCNHWCKWYGYCTNTTGSHCLGLELPDEEESEQEERIERLTY